VRYEHTGLEYSSNNACTWAKYGFGLRVGYNMWYWATHREELSNAVSGVGGLVVERIVGSFR